VLDESALFALPIAHEEAFGAHLAPACRALLALAAKSIWARDALAIQPKVAVFARLTLEAVITALAINVYEVRASLAETVLNKTALDAPLIRESKQAEQVTCAEQEAGHNEDSKQVVTPGRAFDARSSFQVVICGL